MKIRRNSWHYWFYTFCREGFTPQSTNLCRYFWRVVLGMGIVTFLCAFAALMITVVGLLFYEHTLGMFIAIGVIVAGVSMIPLYFYIQDKLAERRRAPGYRKPGPGLLRLYLRAKKEKVCPIVTFADSK